MMQINSIARMNAVTIQTLTQSDAIFACNGFMPFVLVYITLTMSVLGVCFMQTPS